MLAVQELHSQRLSKKRIKIQHSVLSTMVAKESYLFLKSILNY